MENKPKCKYLDKLSLDLNSEGKPEGVKYVDALQSQ